MMRLQHLLMCPFQSVGLVSKHIFYFYVLVMFVYPHVHVATVITSDREVDSRRLRQVEQGRHSHLFMQSLSLTHVHTHKRTHIFEIIVLQKCSY